MTKREKWNTILPSDSCLKIIWYHTTITYPSHVPFYHQSQISRSEVQIRTTLSVKSRGDSEFLNPDTLLTSAAS